MKRLPERKKNILRHLLLVVAVGLTAVTTAYAKWSFGVHGDTQWSPATDPTGKNPNTVSAAVARALNEQFTAKNVKFVIAVGDLSDRAGDAAMYTRADVAQSLYDQGVGFFPLRGNHEEMGSSYGLDPERNLNLPAYFNAFPQTKGSGNLYGATAFNSPASIMTTEGIEHLDGLSYSFDFGTSGENARFMIVDVEKTHYKNTAIDPVYGQGYTYSTKYKFTVYQATQEWSGVTTTYDANGKAVLVDLAITIPVGTWFRIDSQGRKSTNFYAEDMENPGQGTNDIFKPIENWAVLIPPRYSSTGTEYWPGMQQEWVNARLDKATRGTEHAFVFSHRPLMGENHVDCLFGSNPGSKDTTQNFFYASLMNNGVRYMISGHDHLHNRAIVKSPDGLSQVEQLISCGASTKFYSPASLSRFNTTYGNVKYRETQVSQELNNIGYYIYTIDGPRVTVDYYSDAAGNFADDTRYPDGTGSLVMPEFNFVKKETWGYSLNGKQFSVAQQQPYTIVADFFEGTTAKIVNGVNNSTATDSTPGTPRALARVVATGWHSGADGTLKSRILTLWGMGSFGSPDSTDQFTLSMSYDATTTGACALMSEKEDGTWVYATDLNYGGNRKFVAGPYKSSFGLGTYGIDHATKTVWAVINHASDFAVHVSADGDQDLDGDVDDIDVSIISSYRNNPASTYPSADLDNDGRITSLDVRKAILLKTVN